MANKSYRLNQDVIRQLRRDRGWTQEDAGRELIKLTNPGAEIIRSKEQLEKEYQRIELRGSTSLKRLKALASIYEVDMAVLEGTEKPTPVDYVERIHKLLAHTLNKGGNESLRDTLRRISEQDSESTFENELRRYSFDIAARIERAQLSCNSKVLRKLSEQTGVPEEELVRPSNAHGYWLCTVSVHNLRMTKIIHGLPMIADIVPEVVEQEIKALGDDTLIRVFRDSLWYRVEIIRPNKRGEIFIDLVCCHPDSKGIRWGEPTVFDALFMDDLLGGWARATGKCVEAFEYSPPSGSNRHE